MGLDVFNFTYQVAESEITRGLEGVLSPTRWCDFKLKNFGR
jgi:hypothetical protein